MRPCGPVRHHYSRPTRLVTKKEIYELLDTDKLEIMVQSGKSVIPYDGPISRLKSSLRSRYSSVDQARSSSEHYKMGCRTILMTGSGIALVVIMRVK